MKEPRLTVRKDRLNRTLRELGIDVQSFHKVYNRLYGVRQPGLDEQLTRRLDEAERTLVKFMFAMRDILYERNLEKINREVSTRVFVASKEERALNRTIRQLKKMY